MKSILTIWICLLIATVLTPKWVLSYISNVHPEQFTSDGPVRQVIITEIPRRITDPKNIFGQHMLDTFQRGFANNINVHWKHHRRPLHDLYSESWVKLGGDQRREIVNVLPVKIIINDQEEIPLSIPVEVPAIPRYMGNNHLVQNAITITVLETNLANLFGYLLSMFSIVGSDSTLYSPLRIVHNALLRREISVVPLLSLLKNISQLKVKDQLRIILPVLMKTAPENLQSALQEINIKLFQRREDSLWKLIGTAPINLSITNSVKTEWTNNTKKEDMVTRDPVSILRKYFEPLLKRASQQKDVKLLKQIIYFLLLHFPLPQLNIDTVVSIRNLAPLLFGLAEEFWLTIMHRMAYYTITDLYAALRDLLLLITDIPNISSEITAVVLQILKALDNNKGQEPSLNKTESYKTPNKLNTTEGYKYVGIDRYSSPKEGHSKEKHHLFPNPFKQSELKRKKVSQNQIKEENLLNPAIIDAIWKLKLPKVTNNLLSVIVKCKLNSTAERLNKAEIIQFLLSNPAMEQDKIQIFWPHLHGNRKENPLQHNLMLSGVEGVIKCKCEKYIPHKTQSRQFECYIKISSTGKYITDCSQSSFNKLYAPTSLPLETLSDKKMHATEIFPTQRPSGIRVIFDVYPSSPTGNKRRQRLHIFDLYPTGVNIAYNTAKFFRPVSNITPQSSYQLVPLCEESKNHELCHLSSSIRLILHNSDVVNVINLSRILHIKVYKTTADVLIAIMELLLTHTRILDESWVPKIESYLKYIKAQQLFMRHTDFVIKMLIIKIMKETNTYDSDEVFLSLLNWLLKDDNLYIIRYLPLAVYKSTAEFINILTLYYIQRVNSDYKESFILYQVVVKVYNTPYFQTSLVEAVLDLFYANGHSRLPLHDSGTQSVTDEIRYPRPPYEISNPHDPFSDNGIEIGKLPNEEYNPNGLEHPDDTFPGQGIDNNKLPYHPHGLVPPDEGSDLFEPPYDKDIFKNETEHKKPPYDEYNPKDLMHPDQESSYHKDNSYDPFPDQETDNTKSADKGYNSHDLVPPDEGSATFKPSDEKDSPLDVSDDEGEEKEPPHAEHNTNDLTHPDQEIVYNEPYEKQSPHKLFPDQEDEDIGPSYEEYNPQVFDQGADEYNPNDLVQPDQGIESNEPPYQKDNPYAVFPGQAIDNTKSPYEEYDPHALIPPAEGSDSFKPSYGNESPKDPFADQGDNDKESTYDEYDSNDLVIPDQGIESNRSSDERDNSYEIFPDQETDNTKSPYKDYDLVPPDEGSGTFIPVIENDNPLDALDKEDKEEETPYDELNPDDSMHPYQGGEPNEPYEEDNSYGLFPGKGTENIKTPYGEYNPHDLVAPDEGSGSFDHDQVVDQEDKDKKTPYNEHNLNDLVKPYHGIEPNESSYDNPDDLFPNQGTENSKPPYKEYNPHDLVVPPDVLDDEEAEDEHNDNDLMHPDLADESNKPWYEKDNPYGLLPDKETDNTESPYEEHNTNDLVSDEETDLFEPPHEKQSPHKLLPKDFVHPDPGTEPNETPYEKYNPYGLFPDQGTDYITHDLVLPEAEEKKTPYDEYNPNDLVNPDHGIESNEPSYGKDNSYDPFPDQEMDNIKSPQVEYTPYDLLKPAQEIDTLEPSNGEDPGIDNTKSAHKEYNPDYLVHPDQEPESVEPSNEKENSHNLFPDLEDENTRSPNKEYYLHDLYPKQEIVVNIPTYEIPADEENNAHGLFSDQPIGNFNTPYEENIPLLPSETKREQTESPNEMYNFPGLSPGLDVPVESQRDLNETSSNQTNLPETSTVMPSGYPGLSTDDQRMLWFDIFELLPEDIIYDTTKLVKPASNVYPQSLAQLIPLCEGSQNHRLCHLSSEMRLVLQNSDVINVIHLSGITDVTVYETSADLLVAVMELLLSYKRIPDVSWLPKIEAYLKFIKAQNLYMQNTGFVMNILITELRKETSIYGSNKAFDALLGWINRDDVIYKLRYLPVAVYKSTAEFLGFVIMHFYRQVLIPSKEQFVFLQIQQHVYNIPYFQTSLVEKILNIFSVKGHMNFSSHDIGTPSVTGDIDDGTIQSIVFDDSNANTRYVVSQNSDSPLFDRIKGKNALDIVIGPPKAYTLIKKVLGELKVQNSDIDAIKEHIIKPGVLSYIKVPATASASDVTRVILQRLLQHQGFNTRYVSLVKRVLNILQTSKLPHHQVRKYFSWPTYSSTSYEANFQDTIQGIANRYLSQNQRLLELLRKWIFTTEFNSMLGNERFNIANYRTVGDLLSFVIKTLMETTAVISDPQVSQMIETESERVKQEGTEPLISYLKSNAASRGQ